MTMRIKKTDIIAGLPAFEARRMMRLLRHWTVSEKWASQWHPKADLRKFEEEGFVEKDNAFGEGHYEITTRGISLSNATAGKPIHRKTADQILADFLVRVQVVNNHPDFLYTVERVVVFGSYLRPEVDRLGDLDIAIEMKFRPEKASGFKDTVAALLHRADESDRCFGTYLERLSWCMKEVQLFLRNKSKAISLTNTSNPILNGVDACPQRTLWSRDSVGFKVINTANEAANGL